MITLDKFYKQAVKNNILIDEFEFRKTRLNPVYKKFIIGLIGYIGNYFYFISQLSKFKKIDKEFIAHLNFINEFYFFLKKKSENFKNYSFNIQNFEKSNKKVLDEKILKKYKDIYHKETFHTLFEVLPLLEHMETVTFDNSLEEVYCDSIKALEALIYINNNECENMLDDLLFELKITLFTHTLPHHFEDLDTDCLGLISQTNFLKKLVD